MILIPAYGRRYNSSDEALADWENGRSFKLIGGPYCSIRDTERMVDDYGYIEILWNFPCTPAAAQRILVGGQRDIIDILMGHI